MYREGFISTSFPAMMLTASDSLWVIHTARCLSARILP